MVVVYNVMWRQLSVMPITIIQIREALDVPHNVINNKIDNCK